MDPRKITHFSQVDVEQESHDLPLLRKKHNELHIYHIRYQIRNLVHLRRVSISICPKKTNQQSKDSNTQATSQLRFAIIISLNSRNPIITLHCILKQPQPYLNSKIFFKTLTDIFRKDKNKICICLRTKLSKTTLSQTGIPMFPRKQTLRQHINQRIPHNLEVGVSSIKKLRYQKGRIYCLELGKSPTKLKRVGSTLTTIRLLFVKLTSSPYASSKPQKKFQISLIFQRWETINSKELTLKTTLCKVNTKSICKFQILEDSPNKFDILQVGDYYLQGVHPKEKKNSNSTSLLNNPYKPFSKSMKKQS